MLTLELQKFSKNEEKEQRYTKMKKRLNNLEEHNELLKNEIFKLREGEENIASKLEKYKERYSDS